MQRSRGFRTKTRQVLKKRARARGLSPITRGFQTFEAGEKVNIKIDPSIHKGMPHSRFHGLTGVVIAPRGTAYEVRVMVGNKPKTIISRPEHLVRAVA